MTAHSSMRWRLHSSKSRCVSGPHQGRWNCWDRGISRFTQTTPVVWHILRAKLTSHPFCRRRSWAAMRLLPIRAISSANHRYHLNIYACLTALLHYIPPSSILTIINILSGSSQSRDITTVKRKYMYPAVRPAAQPQNHTFSMHFLEHSSSLHTCYCILCSSGPLRHTSQLLARRPIRLAVARALSWKQVIGN